MQIIPYSPEYKDEFVELNRAWISEMFVMEPEDERELSNIEGYIQAGGQIFFALDDDGAVMACCMIGPREDGDWEEGSTGSSSSPIRTACKPFTCTGNSVSWKCPWIRRSSPSIERTSHSSVVSSPSGVLAKVHHVSELDAVFE